MIESRCAEHQSRPDTAAEWKTVGTDLIKDQEADERRQGR